MFKKRFLFTLSFLVLIVSSAIVVDSLIPPGKRIANAVGGATQHYLYVIPDGGLYVYDIDNGFSQVKHVNLPIVGGRGVAVDPASASLFISYYGSTRASSPGWLLKYNLLTDTVVWNMHLSFSVDSPAITPDGTKIYMPESQASSSGIWHILSAADGSSLGSISIGGGRATHNTVVSLNGSHAYLGALNYNSLVQVDTSTNQITKQMGPLKAGVRPFTINGTETLAFTTATGFLGFQVSDITTGNVLYTVPVNGFTSNTSVPSHGISLSPDEKEVYLIDNGNSYAHVFDVSGLPSTAPKQVADIPLRSMSGSEGSCSVDCQKEGWMLHSLDGRYVFVGDSGDVIDVSTRQSIANLPALFDSRKYIEVDFSNGAPVATTTRYGLGHVTSSTGMTPTATVPAGTPTITPSSSPSPTASPSPTPGSTLAQDTFQRPNQAHWGTASDGHTWGGDANTANVFSIVNNTGQVSNGTTSYSATLGPVATNADVVFTGSMSNYSNNNLGSVLRWKNGNNWYKAYINGGSLIVQKKVNGATTILGSVPFAATTGTSYTLRFRVVGTTLFARVWQTGTTEPTNWMIMVTDTSFSSGFCGLRMLPQNGTTASYTSFLATTA